MKLFASALFVSLICYFPQAWAQLQMPAFFSDHMVLQRNVQVPVWGKAGAGEIIIVKLNEKPFRTQADQQGKWRLKLPATVAGGPYSLTVQGKNSELKFQDILFGDVFLCGGQSNMEWTVSKLPVAQKEARTANYSQIRHVNIERDMALKPKDDVLPTAWKVCSPENVHDFSAVGYFFAKHLYQKQNVPIGLISSNWGGTPIESWMSTEVLQTFPQMAGTIRNLADEGATIESLKRKYQNKMRNFATASHDKDPGVKEQWYAAGYPYKNWPQMNLPGIWDDWTIRGHDGTVWFKRSFVLPEAWKGDELKLFLGDIDDDDKVWVNGKFIGETRGKNIFRRYLIPATVLKAGANEITIRVTDVGGVGGFSADILDFYLTPILDQSEKLYLDGPWHYRIGLSRLDMPTPIHHHPSILYNAMIAPLTPMAMKGIIWYQGETNEARAKEYGDLFPAMIQQWRQDWKENLPFAFVQLANYKPPVEEPIDSYWPELREAQSQALKLPKTGMAVTIDIGVANEVHPPNKQDVGERLGLVMRKIAYGEDLVFSGPSFAGMDVEGNKIKIRFKHVGSGLCVKDKYGYLKGFTIAGANQKWYYAKAEVTGPNEITVYHPNIEKPVAVRFAWADNPEEANLYNMNGLPAVPFRTDNWPGVSDNNRFAYQ